MKPSALLWIASRSDIAQSFGDDFIELSPKGELIGANVIGAMAYCLDPDKATALLPDPTEYVRFINDRVGGKSLFKVRPNPISGRGKYYVWKIALRLNDIYRCSFREIADWMHSVRA